MRANYDVDLAVLYVDEILSDLRLRNEPGEHADVDGEVFHPAHEVLIMLLSEERRRREHDDLPESAFLFVGTIDEAVEKAKTQAE